MLFTGCRETASAAEGSATFGGQQRCVTFGRQMAVHSAAASTRRRDIAKLRPNEKNRLTVSSHILYMCTANRFQQHTA
jgi:hypothetical protein